MYYFSKWVIIFKGENWSTLLELQRSKVKGQAVFPIVQRLKNDAHHVGAEDRK